MRLNKMNKVHTSLFIALMLIMNSKLSAYATAVQADISGNSSLTDEMPVYDFFDMGCVIEADALEMQVESFPHDAISTYSTVTKTYTVNWTVAAGSTLKSAVKFFMSAGDTMTFNIS